MRYLLLLILFSSSLYADEVSYLKVSTSPGYPAPGAGVERVIKILIQPSFPTDSTFDSIFNELSKIAERPNARFAPLHVRTVYFEAMKNGRPAEAVYWNGVDKDNEQLRSQWSHIFQLTKEVSVEQLNP